ncbi:MAG: potassium channel family protein [Planctomycetota bacterium]
MSSSSEDSEKIWWQNLNFWLLLCLTSFFVLYPLLDQTFVARRFLDLVLTVAVILILCAQTDLKKWNQFVFLIVGLSTILLGWIPIDSAGLALVSPILYSCFFAVGVSIFCHRILTASSVDVDVLLAASCAYILLGFLFSTLFVAIWHVDPSSFELANAEDDAAYQLIYFSFVTLTTLGYGEILPNSHATQMLAALEAILGQLFVTIVVGLLVGLFVSQKSKSSDFSS